MDIERSKQPIKQISMVPLINVVFLLLIFFLVAGTVEKFDVVPIDLPVADSGQVLDEGHIVILLGRHNEIIINDELVATEDVRPVLEEQLSLNKNRIITVKADSELEAHKLIQMMDTIKLSGGKNLSLITQTLGG
ncbi:MAG: hypothetical protein CMM94_01210 [Rickettsiales bacterium]|nr:hypothetical protein [Rickettsiales bacterium]|tara:strand:- start:366 stop:770 length:405 start_codon:yes stop_codon:yes gene_type:complete